MSSVNVKQYIDPSYKLYINGEWTEGSKGEKLDSINPSNGEKLSEFINASHADVDAAVDAAQKAFPEWSKVGIEERSNILLKIADVMEENIDHLAMIETLDNGKPLRETNGADLRLAVDHFRYFAGVIRSEEGTAQQLDENNLTIVLKEPLGVVGQIVPWNFPILMAAWKLAPALAAGNTIVITPSSSTSLSLLEFAKLFDPLLPKGVVNIITGKGSESGDYLLNHEGISKLAFTGSTEVGYKVAKAAANRLIPSTLELGGKSANIIFNDAPWDRAIEGVQMGILLNQGQVCSAGSRIFVQEDIYDDFLKAMKEAFEKVKVGLPWKEGVQMGAQINQKQLDKILEYVELGKEEGAKVVTGGYQLKEDELGDGAFMAPTILADADNKMRIAQEEIFGPVATVIKFKDEDEVIQLANDSDYGLAGGVFTRDINKALRVSRGIHTGRMWVNQFTNVTAGAPFGGYKKSGIGRETYKSILDAYTQTKNIFINTSEETDGMY